MTDIPPQTSPRGQPLSLTEREHVLQDLPDWHPLKSGRRDSVHEAGISVRGRLGAMEDDIDPEDLIDRIVRWPMRGPRRRKA